MGANWQLLRPVAGKKMAYLGPLLAGQINLRSLCGEFFVGTSQLTGFAYLIWTDRLGHRKSWILLMQGFHFS